MKKLIRKVTDHVERNLERWLTARLLVFLMTPCLPFIFLGWVACSLTRWGKEE